MVIFDSTVEPYHGRAVYEVGEARELSGNDLDRALAAYPRQQCPLQASPQVSSGR